MRLLSDFLFSAHCFSCFFPSHRTHFVIHDFVQFPTLSQAILTLSEQCPFAYLISQQKSSSNLSPDLSPNTSRDRLDSLCCINNQCAMHSFISMYQCHTFVSASLFLLHKTLHIQYIFNAWLDMFQNIAINICYHRFLKNFIKSAYHQAPGYAMPQFKVLCLLVCF